MHMDHNFRLIINLQNQPTDGSDIHSKMKYYNCFTKHQSINYGLPQNVDGH
jgi:hypothetical protein